MKNNYNKYKTEGANVSFSTFCRGKPFNVRKPKLSDRDTCACIRHCNLSFKAQKLKKLNIISTSNLDNLMDLVSCSLKSYNCTYGRCLECKNKTPNFNINTYSSEYKCEWIHWVRKDHEYIKRNRNGSLTTTKTKRYMKEVCSGTVSKLQQIFIKELLEFKKHYFNIINHHSNYRTTINSLNDNEACVLVDFSQNYLCKFNHAVQSCHFGASQ